ncbi:MAG: response regulator [Armatimonadota bacterium]
MALNILVVDDSAVTRAVIIRTLRLSGVPLGEVHEASNGAEALRVLDEHWVDIAFVDIHMPVMAGDEMICQLRARQETADLPIIVVSSEASEERVRFLREQGVLFVHKPFTPEALRGTVLSAVGVVSEVEDGEAPAFGDGASF